MEGVDLVVTKGGNAAELAHAISVAFWEKWVAANEDLAMLGEAAEPTPVCLYVYVYVYVYMYIYIYIYIYMAANEDLAMLGEAAEPTPVC